jgi:Secretion system C-terminal sorting domain
MKHFTQIGKGILTTLFLLFTIVTVKAQPSITVPASSPVSVLVGDPVSFTGQRGTSGNYNGGSGSTYTFTWQSSPGANASFSPATNSGTYNNTTSTFSTTATFSAPGTYVVSVVGVRGAGSNTNSSNSITVNVSAPTPPTPIGCNGQYYVSYGSANGASSTTSMVKLAFAGSTITSNPFATSPTGIGFNAIGISPVDGFLYGVRYAPLQLVRVSANATNNVTAIGNVTGTNITSGDNAYAGCFDANGDFYFMTEDNNFYVIAGINYPTAPLAATRIGSVTPGSGFFVDMAVDPTNGDLYGVAGVGGTGKNLYKINKATGALTLIGEYSGTQYIAALFFNETGTLYGYRQDGTYQQVNKTTAAQTQVGTAPNSFGRVFHDLDFTANPGNQLCPTIANPNPTFPLVVTVTNQSNSQKTGLTYTLNISDIKKRFRFTESAATIKTNLISAGLATAGSTVTLTTEAPATGTNYNKIVVTGFQTGAVNAVNSFTVQVQLYTLGGIYDPVPLQSEISGLPAIIGSVDLSNDPGTIAPDDATVVAFCPGITLPVEFKSFTAVRNRSNVLLTWETSMEKNNSGFAVERNINGVWQQIAWVPSQALGGNSDVALVYTLTDLNNVKGVSQYRIRQVDFDAKSKYSEVRSVRGDGQLGQTIVYPNPTNNGKVNIIFEEGSLKRDISVYDMSGREIQQMKAVTTNNITIENLNPGMYMVRIIAVETGEQVVEKVVVNKR